MAASDAVVVDQVSKRFGRLAALDRVDLRLTRGSFVLLAGPNGAGKSTLLRLLAGLGRPSAGRVQVGGGDPAVDLAVRGAIGLLSHQLMVYEELTALENLRFFARLYGIANAEETALRALAEVDLEGRSQSLARTFSRGMKQRLALARVSLHRPDLLLFDEPFSGLDQRSVDALQRRLRGLHRSGVTCILVTHRLEDAAGLADHIVLLEHGRVRWQERGQWSSREALELVYAERMAGPT